MNYFGKEVTSVARRRWSRGVAAGVLWGVAVGELWGVTVGELVHDTPYAVETEDIGILLAIPLCASAKLTPSASDT